MANSLPILYCSNDSWMIRADEWMQMMPGRSVPTFLNLWGVSRPTTTMSPGPASMSSFAVMRAEPERTIHVSEHGRLSYTGRG
jgi:hypothetical protein